MRKQIVLSASLLLAFAAAACSSGGSTSSSTTTGSGGGTSSTTTTGSTTTTTGSGTPATSCTMPGDKGNDIGVGEYCSPGGGQCSGFADANLCLADVGQDQWFCTRIGCAKDADCGMAAHCHMDPAGAACVPDKCEPAGTGGGGAGGGGGSK